ncbi:MAG: hypothetical protein K2K91_08940 [Ruminococcus sp.]|nr:hypothetical protein [Ruminococcus sp.]
MTSVSAIFVRPDGEESKTIRVLNFSFEKESYMPYTKLSMTFSANEALFNSFDSPFDYSYVMFYLNDECVHKGIIDDFKLTDESGVKIGILKSRGFTSLLLDNHYEPGMHTNISIDNLIDCYNLPFVEHEPSTDTSYIYVKPNSSMWDAVVNLSYKLYGTYPYIKGQNMVKMTIDAPEKTLEFDESRIFFKGSEINTRRLVSDFYMADIDDTYGNFYHENIQAKQKKIIRNRYFDLDQRFLYEPEKALHFRNTMQSRAWKRYFIAYNGTNKEDLFDAVSFGNIVNGRIRAIKVTGDKNGIQTELSVYEDLFTP